MLGDSRNTEPCPRLSIDLNPGVTNPWEMGSRSGESRTGQGGVGEEHTTYVTLGAESPSLSSPVKRGDDGTRLEGSERRG